MDTYCENDSSTHSQLENEDFGFMDENDKMDEGGNINDEHQLAVMSPHVSSALCALGGQRQYFGGLAVAPLSCVSKQLAHSSLSHEEVMKLRSIMRFSIEYHNPLVVHVEHAACSSPIKEFTNTSSECFDWLYTIIVAISAESLDSQQVLTCCHGFRRLYIRLAELEGPCKEQVKSTTLKQSISAVQGQMKDFLSLVEASILPNVSSNHDGATPRSDLENDTIDSNI